MLIVDDAMDQCGKFHHHFMLASSGNEKSGLLFKAHRMSCDFATIHIHSQYFLGRVASAQDVKIAGPCIFPMLHVIEFNLWPQRVAK